MGLSPRAAGLSRHDAQRYWRTTHADLFRQVPDLLSYVQNHAVLDDSGTPLLGDVGFDIFSEVTFGTAQALEASVASDYYQSVVLPDEAMVLDAGGRSFVRSRWEPEARPDAPDSCKLIAILARQDDAVADGAALGADLIYSVDAGSGPIGDQAGQVLHWVCTNVAAAMSRHRQNMMDRNYALRLIAATVTRANIVVSPPAGWRVD